MLVKIKNNRLALEGQYARLADYSDRQLRDFAAKYQIGYQHKIARETNVGGSGVVDVRKEQVIEAKPRVKLENEVRKALTMTMYIPKELWTQEQSDAFYSNDLLNESSLSEEQRVKKDANIMIVLPPYEKGKIGGDASMIATVTEDQWEWIKIQFCSKFNPVKDGDGKKVGTKRAFTARLVAEEYLPENDDDKEELAKREEAKAKKSGKAKKVETEDEGLTK